MLIVASLVFTVCDISLSCPCIRTSDIQTSSIFFKQLVCMLCMQYLLAVVGKSEIRSTERSLIVSLSVGKQQADFIKGIGPCCLLLISARI